MPSGVEVSVEGNVLKFKKGAHLKELDKFFAYGYGAHHFWLKHRKLSNGEPKEYRLLKVEF
ncbi:MAG: hypothetical protein ACFNS5_11500 [Prevotella melaninogenica]